MTPEQKAELADIIDTIIRDEAYDGGFGMLNGEQFNKMAAHISNLIMDEVETRL